MAPSQNPLTLSREDLYGLVWSNPMTELAQDFGLSDVALAKRCRKLGVPVPGRGYWARIAAGQTPRQPPLRKRADDVMDYTALTFDAPARESLERSVQDRAASGRRAATVPRVDRSRELPKTPKSQSACAAIGMISPSMPDSLGLSARTFVASRDTTQASLPGASENTVWLRASSRRFNRLSRSVPNGFVSLNLPYGNLNVPRRRQGPVIFSDPPSSQRSCRSNRHSPARSPWNSGGVRDAADSNSLRLDHASCLEADRAQSTGTR